MEIINIHWGEGGYWVSKPNWDGGDVVMLDDVKELVNALSTAERHMVTMFSGMTPHANYGPENRFADDDEVVMSIRAILSKWTDQIGKE